MVKHKKCLKYCELMSLGLLSFKTSSAGLMQVTKGGISAFPTCFCSCLYFFNFYTLLTSHHINYVVNVFQNCDIVKKGGSNFSPVEHIYIVYIISLGDGHIRAAFSENCCIFVHSGSIFKEFLYQSCCSVFEIKIKLWKQTLEQQPIPHPIIWLLLSGSDFFTLAL